MQTQPETAGADARRHRPSEWRQHLRDAALERAIRKRAMGVPTYTVPEAAALLSISQEHLYRLIAAERFPVVRVDEQDSRKVVNAKVIELLLEGRPLHTDLPGGVA